MMSPNPPRSADNRFDLARLRAGIAPWRLYWFASVKSTNDHAATMRRQGRLFAPAVVLAGRQVAGRGRGSNTWWSGGGSLTATFALPVGDAVAPHQLPLMAGLAVRNAVAELTGDNGISLKWPNDLLYDGRKLAGLLCERHGAIDLIGVGLNVNLDAAAAPPELQTLVTSLQMIAGKPLDITQVLIETSQHLRRMMDRASDRPFADLLLEYDSHHALIGRSVTIAFSDDEPALTGTVEGLDEMGRLLLRAGKTLHHVIAGHVTVH